MTSCQHYICFSCIQNYLINRLYHTIYPENYEEVNIQEKQLSVPKYNNQKN